jgi:hypothetical protein
MSKFLLNLVLQISKALEYLKIKFYSEKNFPSLSAHSAFGPAMAHLFFSNWPLPLSPLGLGLSAGPSHPLGPADCALVASCRIATSHTGKRLTSRRLHPSSCLADRWAPPIITFLRLRPSSTSSRPPRQAAMAAVPSPAPPSLYGRPLPLLNLGYNHHYNP